MKFLSVLPVIGAFLGAVSATPLEPRGGSKHMSYSRYCPWEYRDHQWSCDSGNYDWGRKCCKNEKKCWYDPWECKWECCDAKDWDWDNECPRSYKPHKYESQKKYHYYGGGGHDSHKNYDDDCNHGRKDNYNRGGNYHDWKNSQGHHGGH